MSYTLNQRLLSELIGTAVLTLFGAGSVIAALTVGKGTLDYAGLGFISLAFAIAVTVAVYATAPISGGHINPAVTFALAVTGRFPWREVIPYFAAQLVGGAAGGLLVIATFGTKAGKLGAGSTALAPGVSYGSGILVEVIATFILMLAVMAVAVDGRSSGPGWAPYIIGLAVACAILVFGPLTGPSLNPARTFGPYVAAALFDGTVKWSEFPLYWIGPLLGAVLAAVGYDVIAKTRQAAAEDAAPVAAQPETVDAR